MFSRRVLWWESKFLVSHSKMSETLCSTQEYLLSEGTCPQHAIAGSRGCHSTDLQKKPKSFSQTLHMRTTANQSVCSVTDQKNRVAKNYSHLQRTFFPPRLMKHSSLWRSLLISSISTDRISHLPNFILETWAEHVHRGWYPPRPYLSFPTRTCKCIFAIWKFSSGM